jgi:hypothetical protein
VGNLLRTKEIIMPAAPRRTTIHDLAALRVHPDGTRVLPPPIAALIPRKSHQTIKDVRGNWIAHDAGGVGGIKRNKKKVTDEDEGDREEIQFSDEERDGEETGSRKKNKGKGKEKDTGVRSSPKDPRTRKRRRFEHDLGFLEPSVTTTPAEVPESLPPPSSVRLQYISVVLMLTNITNRIY